MAKRHPIHQAYRECVADHCSALRRLRPAWCGPKRGAQYWNAPKGRPARMSDLNDAAKLLGTWIEQAAALTRRASDAGALDFPDGAAWHFDEVRDLQAELVRELVAAAGKQLAEEQLTAAQTSDAWGYAMAMQQHLENLERLFRPDRHAAAPPPPPPLPLDRDGPITLHVPRELTSLKGLRRVDPATATEAELVPTLVAAGISLHMALASAAHAHNLIGLTAPAPAMEEEARERIVHAGEAIDSLSARANILGLDWRPHVADGVCRATGLLEHLAPGFGHARACQRVLAVFDADLGGGSCGTPTAAFGHPPAAPA